MIKQAKQDYGIVTKNEAGKINYLRSYSTTRIFSLCITKKEFSQKEKLKIYCLIMEKQLKNFVKNFHNLGY